MVVAVLLAAGGGTRFAGTEPKLLTEVAGRPLVLHALGAARAAGLRVIVVTGAVDLESVLPADVTVVHNPQWAEGQAVSVRAALTVADSEGEDAVVVGLGDQPGITPEAWRAVADTPGELVVATYDGQRGHPVKLGRAVWPLLPIAGDAVGRAVMRHRPDLVREIRCEGDPSDIDTLEDLRRWS